MSDDFTPKTYTFSQKWGDDPFTALGHTQVPDALIVHAARLGLLPEECWLIVCILRFKHTPDNPYPSQERLAAILGQSADTVRRLLRRIQRKDLVRVERVRGDLGHYTHSVYDFTPLRHALNEIFYQDHPEDRPKAASQMPTSATVQNCTVVENFPQKSPDSATTPQKVPQPPRKIARNYPAKSDLTTVQNCGTKKSQKKENIKEKSETFNVVGATKREAASEAISGARTSNVSRTDCKPLSSGDAQAQPSQTEAQPPQPAPPEMPDGEPPRSEPPRSEPPRSEPPRSEPPRSEPPRSVTARPMLTLEHQRMADRVVTLTGDEKSRRRYEQLASLALDAPQGVELWDAVATAVHARLRKSGDPVRSPGAYFCKTLVHLFTEAQIYVPVGTPQERKEVREAIHQSLQQCQSPPGTGEASPPTAPPAPLPEPPLKARGREFWETQDSAFARDRCRANGWHWQGHLPEEE